MTTTKTTTAANECDRNSFHNHNYNYNNHQHQHQRQSQKMLNIDSKIDIPNAITYINFDSLRKKCVDAIHTSSSSPSSMMAINSDNVVNVNGDDDNDNCKNNINNNSVNNLIIVQSNCIDNYNTSNKTILSKNHIDQDYDEDDDDDELEDDMDDEDDNDELDDNEPFGPKQYYTNQISRLHYQHQKNHKNDLNNRSTLLMNHNIIKNCGKDDDRDSLVGTSASDEESEHCNHSNIKIDVTKMNKMASISEANNNFYYHEDIFYDNDAKSNKQRTNSCESSNCYERQNFSTKAVSNSSTLTKHSSKYKSKSLSPTFKRNSDITLKSSTNDYKFNDNVSLSDHEISDLSASSTPTSLDTINLEQKHSPIHSYPPSLTLASIRDAVSHLTRLDDFNVVKLSQGFFSQVFKVTHLRTGKIMVLKMNKNAGNRGNALKEIELLNKLNHVNIVAYLGTVVHEGGLHPLLEYINGGTLEQLIQKYYPSSLNEMKNSTLPNIHCFGSVTSPKVHRLLNPDKTFIKLMNDVCCGMAYLHSQNYLHRDLASKNIFIRKHITIDSYMNHYAYNEFDDERLEAVIGDFGFACCEPDHNQKLSTVGSPYWLAPECLNNKWYNHKCDIFSYGVICCELNWHVPSDPDYLPRLKNYAIDFAKLETLHKNDTLLAKIAMMACQYDPEKRPEFHQLMKIFDSYRNNNNNDDNDGDLKSLKKNNKQQQKENEMKISENHYHEIELPRAPFKRFNSLDSHLLCFDSKQKSDKNDESAAIVTNENNQDIFEQHLLRRRNSALSSSSSSSSSSGKNSSQMIHGLWK